MGYSVSATDASFDSLDNLYTAPIHAICYRIVVTTLALFLLVASLSVEAYNNPANDGIGMQPRIELIDYGNKDLMGVGFTDSQIVIKRERVQIYALEVSELWQRQATFGRLLQSFYANFDDGQTDMDRFVPVFNMISEEISSLRIKYAFVDVSRSTGLIDFNLNLEEGVFLSIAKNVEEDMNNVMFTIARNQQTVAIDEMPLSELILRVKDVMTRMKEVSRA